MTKAASTGDMGAREKLLGACSELFYSRGINATGIDTLIAKAKVAKASLYNNFKSKDDLIVAYLEVMSNAWLATALSADDETASSEKRVDLLFTSIETSASSPSFNGCPFASAIAELPHNKKVISAVKKYRTVFFGQISNITGKPTSSKIVQEIGLLYDGAITSVKFNGDATGVRAAKLLATRLLRADQKVN